MVDVSHCNDVIKTSLSQTAKYLIQEDTSLAKLSRVCFKLFICQHVEVYLCVRSHHDFSRASYREHVVDYIMTMANVVT